MTTFRMMTLTGDQRVETIVRAFRDTITNPDYRFAAHEIAAEAFTAFERLAELADEPGFTEANDAEVQERVFNALRVQVVKHYGPDMVRRFVEQYDAALAESESVDDEDPGDYPDEDLPWDTVPKDPRDPGFVSGGFSR